MPGSSPRRHGGTAPAPSRPAAAHSPSPDMGSRSASTLEPCPAGNRVRSGHHDNHVPRRLNVLHHRATVRAARPHGRSQAPALDRVRRMVSCGRRQLRTHRRVAGSTSHRAAPRTRGRSAAAHPARCRRLSSGCSGAPRHRRAGDVAGIRRRHRGSRVRWSIDGRYSPARDGSRRGSARTAGRARGDHAGSDRTRSGSHAAVRRRGDGGRPGDLDRATWWSADNPRGDHRTSGCRSTATRRREGSTRIRIHQPRVLKRA